MPQADSKSPSGQEPLQTNEKILYNYTYFNVITIDSFTNNIIKTVTEGIENENDSLIELDSSVYLDQVIEELFYDINEDNELKDLLTEFAKFKLSINKSWDISYDLKDFGLFIDKESNRAQVKYFKKINFSSFSKIKSEIAQIKNQNIKAIRDLLEKMIELLNYNGLDDNDSQIYHTNHRLYNLYVKEIMNNIYTNNNNDSNIMIDL